MANPTSRGQQRDKPFRDALRMEAALLERGEETAAPKGSLRYIARQMLLRACDDTPSAREVGDRLDGKPAQAIIGGDDDEPAIKTVTRIEIVAPDDDKKD